jgi:hypothetical protein
MIQERVFVVAGDWAVASDGIQWMLMRRRSQRLGGWHGVSFVRSTRDILARCMREKGVDDDTARLLLSELPDSFDQWKATQSGLELAL